jgi:UDP-N-acetylmuramoylalanine--D-glutamate ligase
MHRHEIVILGAGESGTGAAILAGKLGMNPFVSEHALIKEKFRTILKEEDIDFEEGDHNEGIILHADEIIKSPGIPDTVPIIQKAIKKGIPVISEIEFAGRHTDAKMICITGSNGKTTTTLLIHHILKSAGFNVGLAGNVGSSFARSVAKYEYDYYVLEISSFQLDGMYTFRPDISILLNITPDHLDRYENDFGKYTSSKFRILQNQGPEDYFIYCADDAVIQEELAKRIITPESLPFTTLGEIEGEGAFLKDNKLIFCIKQKEFHMTLEEMALQGRHNIYNSMAAGIAARLLDIRKDTIKQCLSDFQNVEHRLEFVASIHGIEFINDSKATNVNSTWYALESLQKKVIWIAGGQDKGNNYSALEPMVKSRVRSIICLGKDNRKIKKYFAGMVESIYETQSADEAVRMGYQIAQKGEVVLLSPACASFDLFENYEDRGNQFKQAVKNL